MLFKYLIHLSYKRRLKDKEDETIMITKIPNGQSINEICSYQTAKLKFFKYLTHFCINVRVRLSQLAQILLRRWIGSNIKPFYQSYYRIERILEGLCRYASFLEDLSIKVVVQRLQLRQLDHYCWRPTRFDAVFCRGRQDEKVFKYLKILL